jgi:hypothetical protein
MPQPARQIRLGAVLTDCRIASANPELPLSTLLERDCLLWAAIAQNAAFSRAIVQIRPASHADPHAAMLPVVCHANAREGRKESLERKLIRELPPKKTASPRHLSRTARRLNFGLMAGRIAFFAACGLLLGTCGVGKLSAKETEAELNRTYPGHNWRCIKGDYGWDYECGKIGLTDAQLRQQGIGVQVDWDSVTARTAP